MTAEQLAKRGVILPIVAALAIGVVLRFFFVDALTKLTGTWIGGVESPHREPGSSGPKGSSAA